MFLGDRTKEIVHRATHREVTAIVTLHLPGIDVGVHPANLGAIIEDRKILSPGRVPSEAFSQAANVWKFDDQCSPLIEKDLVVLKEIRDEIADRTTQLNKGHLDHLNEFERRAVFESEDLVARATGVVQTISINFSESAQKGMLAVTAIPFRRVKNYLLSLAEKAHEQGGSLDSVDIVHSDSISAADYYKIARINFMLDGVEARGRL